MRLVARVIHIYAATFETRSTLTVLDVKFKAGRCFAFGLDALDALYARDLCAGARNQ